MNLKKTSVLFILFLNIACFAQNDLWQPITKKKLSQKNILSRETQPDDFLLFSLNYNLLKQKLQQTQVTGANYKSAPIRIPFPNSEGEIIDYTIEEKSILHPDLAAKFPEIKSYTGVAATGNTIRFSISTFGLHAQLFGNEGSQYIDPHTDDLQVYIVYDKKSLTKKRPFTCMNKEVTPSKIPNENTPFQQKQVANQSFFRTYRLAMASTVEYSNFHISRAQAQTVIKLTEIQKQAAVLSAMVVTMTRVNGIFEKEFAVTMQLVPNNTNVIFIDSDNLSNDDGEAILTQIQPIMDKAIGFQNYDIGHVVSTDGGGGVAYLESVCTSNKAKGVTGSSSPVNDAFDIDFVIHEIGHQFGAYHTFNHSCRNNISTETSYEPGSGSTIMAYAGIGVCDPSKKEQDIQNHSDDYFHAVNIQQINTFIEDVGNCAQTTISSNTAPVVNAGNDYVIPKGTAFKLTGSATDTETNLTYCWEQFDRQQSIQPPSNTSAIGPAFRSVYPKKEPTRYFPQFEDVLNGNLSPKWEMIPAVARNMNFILSVRDNNTKDGGQIGQDAMKVTVSDTGPFKITSPNSANLKWVQNFNYIVSWDIAGTDKNGINTTAVTIKLSIDGGNNYDYILTENTENDGAESVKIPKVISNNCRLLIEAVGNIYYAVNDIPFSIGTENGPRDEFILINPNGTYDSYNFKYSPLTKEKIDIYIFDMMGQMVLQKTIPSSYFINEILDTKSLANGVYIFQLYEADNKITRKFAILR